MLKFKKIKDKAIAQVKAQGDSQPCQYAGEKGAYNCLYDCKTTEHRYHNSKDL